MTEPTVKDLLIVDKDRNILDILDIMFAAEGLSVERYSNGRQALEALERQKFHVVLCDTRMPDIDGKSLLAGIKQRERDARVIMMSVDPYSHREYELLGALEFVSKPLSRQELLSTVATIRRERRCTRRFPVTLPVKVNDETEAHSVNLSTDGILIETDRAFAMGETATITIGAPDREHPVSAKGKVVRVTTEKSLYLTAFCFIENISREILTNLDGITSVL